MKAREFLEQLHRDQVVTAIREAEKKTSGEIRVFISRKSIEDPLKAAQVTLSKWGWKKPANAMES
jgi:hypothetical protein